MSSTWTFQDPKQVKKHGEAVASWYVGWFDPDGRKRCKSCGPGSTGEKLAFREAEKIKAQLITGTYQSNDKKTWQEFWKDYEDNILSTAGESSRKETERAVKRFVRLMKPKLVRSIDSKMISGFIAKRLQERGLKKGSHVTAATVNKDLRHLRLVIRKAVRWEYLPKQPDFDFVREPEKLPTYISPEEFALLYVACDSMTKPTGAPYPPADWWRALLSFCYMTGWRIGSIMAVRWSDIELESGKLRSGFEDNKGNRDQSLILHPFALDHLKKIASFKKNIFPWPHGRRHLFEVFVKLQEIAGVKPTYRKDNYGFHDLRRAFATMNADRMTPDALQVLMQHKDYQTTKKYIAIARQLTPAVANLFVPDVGQKQPKGKASKRAK